MDELDNRNISLQRKKPPWLKLDIPVIQLTPDETPMLKPPVKRLRSVSMPGENLQTCTAAMETSNNYLRPPLERLPSITQSIKSEKRVRFERVNTVPPEGQRVLRTASSIRRRSCIPKIMTRRRSSIPKQIIRYKIWKTMLLMAQQELIGVGGFPPLKRLFLPSCCLETNYKENPGVCCHICGIDQSAGIKRAPSHTDDDHELNLTPLIGEY